MNFNDYSFHDSKILEVRELPEQILEFSLIYVDWDNNTFEPKILRFIDVIYYSVNAIPFAGTQTIMEINELGTIKREFGSGRNTINTERNKIEIITNAGERAIEYITCELITPPNL